MVQLSHPYMTNGKIIALTIQNFIGKVMSLLFKMLFKFAIAFLPRSKHLLIHGCSNYLQWFWNPRKYICHFFHCLPIFLPWSVVPDAMILVFWMFSFKSAFSLFSFTFIKRLFSSSLLSATRVVSSTYLRLSHQYFSRQTWSQLVLHPAWHFTWYTLHHEKCWAGWSTSWSKDFQEKYQLDSDKLVI